MGSGCYGSGEEYAPLVDLSRIGGVVLKSVTRWPRLGNDAPRLVPVAAGLLNAIGLQNPGIDAYLSATWRSSPTRPCAVIGSVAGFSVDDYAYVTERLAVRDEIDAIELNISCPNVAHEGETFACDPRLAERATRAARRATTKPLIVKLSPNVTDITEIARIVEAAGADALAVINTVRGMAIDVERRVPMLGNVTGGLSGAAMRPIALAGGVGRRCGGQAFRSSAKAASKRHATHSNSSWPVLAPSRSGREILPILARRSR